MAASMCPSCKAKSFELKLIRPENSAVDICFIQCSKCGRVIGITDAVNIPAILKAHGELLNETRGLLRELKSFIEAK